MESLPSWLNFVLLLIGFGFVIFWHELGHFLAAKKVGIRVEQFAVGMGHAIFSFRKGIGFKLGNTRGEYERRAKAYLDQHTPKKDAEYTEEDFAKAGDALGLGETEYRLSWIPIGGYVKMMGQDDMDASKKVDDPRAYNKKSVGARMLVISAGVIMNIILAGVLFMLLFLYGYRGPAPVVGSILPNSPAQRAGVKVGDELLRYDGHTIHDFNKLVLNTALSAPGQEVPLDVRRNGVEVNLKITPEKQAPDTKTFISVGIGGTPDLRGPKQLPEDYNPELVSPGVFEVQPGETIVAINGKPVRAGDPKAGIASDYHVLDEALQVATPKNPVQATVQQADGKTREIFIKPHFSINFLADAPIQIAGMQPRFAISSVPKTDYPLFKKVGNGDAIRALLIYSTPDATPDRISNPPAFKFMSSLQSAGDKGQLVGLELERPDGTQYSIEKITPIKLGGGKYGVGVGAQQDESSSVVADVIAGSPAAKAGIPKDVRITSVAGTPVANWFEVRSALQAAGEGNVKITYLDPVSKQEITKELPMNKEALALVQNIRYSPDLQLGELLRIRQTSNALTALGWGAAETRDLTLQFYVTLRRMISNDVSPSNLMGPLGIFQAGHKFANKGGDWLIWFLAMISANLAVVNFLPIPIVDGGHFVFLLIEKFSGKPPSKRVLEMAQLAGLLFIGFVFLFVTWNDIKRMIG